MVASQHEILAKYMYSVNRLICCCSLSFCGVSSYKFIRYPSSQASADPTSDVHIVSFSFRFILELPFSDSLFYLYSTYRFWDARSIEDLGGGARHFERTFSLKRKGAFSKNKKGTSLFIAKSWGAHPASTPHLGSYVYV